MNSYNDSVSGLFTLPDITIPSFIGSSGSQPETSWEESLMADTRAPPMGFARRRPVMQIGVAYNKPLLIGGGATNANTLCISEAPPSFPQQFGSLCRSFPLAMGTSPLDYARANKDQLLTMRPAMNRFDEGDPLNLDPMMHGAAAAANVKRGRGRQPSIPASSYAFYLNECRSRLLRTRPDLSYADITRITGQDWQRLSVTDRQQYADMASADKARHCRETEALEMDEKAPGSDLHLTNKKRKKNPNAPKHPVSAYLFFVAEKRIALCKEHPGMSFGEMAKMIGVQWKEMEGERSTYEEMAEKDKARYEREQIAYAKQEEDGNRPATENGKRRKRAANAPKHPVSAYLFFVAEQRRALSASTPGKSFKEMATDIGQRWKALSHAEREPYLRSAQTDKDRYEREKEEVALMTSTAPGPEVATDFHYHL